MIDKDEAIRLLRKSVANKGSDYIYPRANVESLYFEDNQPSCIVGHAVYDAGYEPSDVDEHVNVLSQDLFDYDARAIFNAAQDLQDTGSSWGIALEAAEVKYRELGGLE